MIKQKALLNKIYEQFYQYFTVEVIKDLHSYKCALDYYRKEENGVTYYKVLSNDETCTDKIFNKTTQLDFLDGLKELILGKKLVNIDFFQLWYDYEPGYENFSLKSIYELDIEKLDRSVFQRLYENLFLNFNLYTNVNLMWFNGKRELLNDVLMCEQYWKRYEILDLNNSIENCLRVIELMINNEKTTTQKIDMQTLKENLLYIFEEFSRKTNSKELVYNNFSVSLWHHLENIFHEHKPFLKEFAEYFSIIPKKNNLSFLECVREEQVFIKSLNFDLEKLASRYTNIYSIDKMNKAISNIISYIHQYSLPNIEKIKLDGVENNQLSCLIFSLTKDSNSNFLKLIDSCLLHYDQLNSYPQDSIEQKNLQDSQYWSCYIRSSLLEHNLSSKTVANSKKRKI